MKVWSNVLSDDIWKRHANRWSVYTRVAANPAMIVALWSRVWLGWWTLFPVALVVVWLVVNPFAFTAVTNPTRWVEKAIYGERLWLHDAPTISASHRAVLRWLIALRLAGMGLMAYGLIALVAWPTVFGAVVLVVAQLWRIDRFSLLFEQHQRPPLSPAESDTTEGEQSSRRGRSDGLGWNREV